LLDAADDVWWLDHGVTPAQADTLPAERAFWMRQVILVREQAQADLAERRAREQK